MIFHEDMNFDLHVLFYQNWPPCQIMSNRSVGFFRIRTTPETASVTNTLNPRFVEAIK